MTLNEIKSYCYVEYDGFTWHVAAYSEYKWQLTYEPRRD